MEMKWSEKVPIAILCAMNVFVQPLLKNISLTARKMLWVN